MGFTPLHIAVQSGNLEIVNYLIDQKAFINSKDNEGNTPLHIAVLNENSELTRCLIEKKSKINSQNKNGNTPLHLAALKGNFKLVKYLSKMKADVNVINKSEKTALLIAIDQQKKQPSLKQYQQITSYLTNISKSINSSALDKNNSTKKKKK